MMRAMSAVEFPRYQVGVLVELGVRLLDSRKVGSGSETIARDLLIGFHDGCMRSGLDRVLGELAEAFPPLDPTDRFALGDHPKLFRALVAQLDAAGLDDGGPRNAKPRQLADCVVAALGLTLTDEVPPTTELDDAVRVEVAAALASVMEAELAVPQIRELVIAQARARCEPNHHGAFDKIAAQLDDRAMRMIKQPKVPIESVQAVQRALADARNTIFERAARTAIDRAQQVLARVAPEAAAKIDLPITHQLTPRDGAVLRVLDARVPKVPVAMAESLLHSLTELVRITWRAPERPVRDYAASQTFVVGELLSHPKFGQGTVTSVLPQRIDVEFPDGVHTLVHARPKT
jgi:hypothetical protein